MDIRKLLRISSPFILLISFQAKSVEDACQYPTYQRFLHVEKNGYKLTQKEYSSELKIRMHDFEILCPRQTEVDLNGDQKRDWVGIVVKDGRFSLMAYLSSPSNQYKVQTLMDYSYFPENTHVNYMSTHELYLLTKNKSLKALAKYALVVNDIGKPSQVYVWDSEKLLHVHTFEGYFKY